MTPPMIRFQHLPLALCFSPGPRNWPSTIVTHSYFAQINLCLKAHRKRRESQGRAIVQFIIQQTVGGPEEGPSLDTLPLLPWIPVCFPNGEGLEALSLGENGPRPRPLGWSRVQMALALAPTHKCPPRAYLPRATRAPLGARLARLWAAGSSSRQAVLQVLDPRPAGPWDLDSRL